MPNTPVICDYTGYDYQKEFWKKSNRKYEDTCEKRLVRRLIKKYASPLPMNRLLDAGGGFGRLIPAYDALTKEIVLADYAQELLERANQLFGKTKLSTVQTDIRELPFPADHFDTVISIRTLHHLPDYDRFFQSVWEVLKPDGLFIFEIPNKRHLLNIIRFILKQLPFNPFSKGAYAYNDTFLNYHPSTVLTALRQSGFEVQKSVNTSFFRFKFLKMLVPTFFLVRLDELFQHLFSQFNLTPSIIIVAKKIK